jgi:hypothetical protein
VAYVLGDWQTPLHASGMSLDQWWLAYFALGGDASAVVLDRYLQGDAQPSALDHNLMAHALNECLHDHGNNWPVPYR